METKQNEEIVFIYDRSGRMKYHPEFHENHGKSWTADDLEYLCKFHDTCGLNDIGFALGRPATSCATKIDYLKKQGQYEFYRNLNKYYV